MMEPWVLGLLGLLGASVGWNLFQRRRLVRIRSDVQARLGEIEGELQQERLSMKAEVERVAAHYEAEHAKALSALEPLRRLDGTASTEAQAQQTLSEALELARKLKDEAEAYAQRLKDSSQVELKAAQDKLRALRREAEVILTKAAKEAHDLVEEAHKRAEEIAGSAYQALREKDTLEESVRAIRNVIDGYGDRYVVPTRSILDGLAADYGHLEAGGQLKAARANSRRMVEHGLAATCDYAEAKRRETAIRFVIDAFNGRVDAILSRAKRDNYGILHQEIQDTYSLVNLLGEAFRNARIVETYLAARQAELKWAVAVQELRERELEEQRHIREQIRDEERAQREIERALRDATKEEETLKKALEQARAEVANASEQEKARYEAKLAELGQRLAEAEAKNQRALSMAQQTRAGNVYIISNIGSFGEDVVKIGMTRRLEPMDRIRELSDASVPFLFDVHAMIYTEDAPGLEKELHDLFEDRRVNRVNYRKEFFRIPLADLREFVARKGLQASFTMVAEAREYRESIAMVKAPPAEAETAA